MEFREINREFIAGKLTRFELISRPPVDEGILGRVHERPMPLTATDSLFMREHNFSHFSSIEISSAAALGRWQLHSTYKLLSAISTPDLAPVSA
jgi:hypothetical protein